MRRASESPFGLFKLSFNRELLLESITLFSELFKNISETPFEQKELTAPQDGFLAEPKTEEQLTFLTSLAYVEEMTTGVQGQRSMC